MTRTLYFLQRKLCIQIIIKEGTNKMMTSDQLRDEYKKRLEREKQCYISKQTNINVSTLSAFKNGRFDLYPELHERLESYLKNN